RGIDYLPTQLYSLPLKGLKQVVDYLVFTSPIHKTPLPSSHFKPFFLALTKDNWLLRFDNITGELLQKIYLGNNYKFTELSWERVGERIVLSCKKPHIFALFSILPLEFITMFEVKQELFGKFVSVTLNNNLLKLVSGFGSNKNLKLYNMWDILDDSNFECKCKIGKWCHLLQIGNSIGKVGIDGLPLNICLKKKPSIVFDINSSEELVSFGGFPYHYILSPSKQKGAFEVRNIETHALVNAGSFDLENATIVPDNLSFIDDHTERLIYRSANETTFYKLLSDNGNSSLIKLFSLSTNAIRSCLKNEKERSRTKRTMFNGRSSRSCTRKTINYNENELERSILDDDFDIDVEIFSILADIPEQKENGKILMFDSKIGKLIKSFEVGKVVEGYHYKLIYDLDIFIIIVEDISGYSEANIFRMTVFDEE
ncbi:DDB1- and CUL4-associated factor 17-like protein, partial [Dinothrombium tinctorium]